MTGNPTSHALYLEQSRSSTVGLGGRGSLLALTTAEYDGRRCLLAQGKTPFLGDEYQLGDNVRMRRNQACS